jgi:hypothetical protein
MAVLMDVLLGLGAVSAVVVLCAAIARLLLGWLGFNPSSYKLECAFGPALCVKIGALRCGSKLLARLNRVLAGRLPLVVTGASLHEASLGFHLRKVS